MIPVLRQLQARFLPPVATAMVLAWLCIPCGAPAAAADDAPTPPAEFARVDVDSDGRPRALQVAIVSFAPADSAYTVDLISAVHIGDKAYYEALNERFRAYDALLYELVVPDGTRDGRELDFDGSIMSSMQIGLKDALGLAFQLEEIDYAAPNFVHADMSSSMLAQSMADRGESLYVYFWRLFYLTIREYARDPLGISDLAMLSSLLGATEGDAVKIALAYEMVKATREGDFLGGGNGSALIAARNEHALGVLRAQIDTGSRRIGLFYGAAHMVDFERRLRAELGLERSAVEWTDAWRLATK